MMRRTLRKAIHTHTHKYTSNILLYNRKTDYVCVCTYKHMRDGNKEVQHVISLELEMGQYALLIQICYNLSHIAQIP